MHPESSFDVCFVKILNNAIGDLLTSRMPEEAPKQDIETFNNNPWHDAHVRVVIEAAQQQAHAASSVLDLLIQRHNIHGPRHRLHRNLRLPVRA